MLTAIIAAVVALVVVAGVLMLLLYLRHSSQSTVGTKAKHNVMMMHNVGASSTLKEATGGQETHVSSNLSSPTNIADNLSGRFAFFGAFAAVVFGALGIKSFTMQVLDGDSYTSAADSNQYSTVLTPAPRGYIYDSEGLALVKNRSSLTILADGDVADDADVVARLSAVLGVPRNVVRQRINDTSAGAQSQRVVASDVTQREVAFIAERADAFSGVTFETRAVREYPYGALAAHVLGYTGVASTDDLLNQDEGSSIQSGDNVGRGGVESYYDRLLTGEHGERKVIADASGRIREVVSETSPKKGSDIYLTIKAPVQYRIDQMLADIIAPVDETVGTGKGVAGAVVVMDVQTGAIIAMSNFPTYSPESFIGGISEETWNIYNDSDPAKSMMINRAIAGTYPAASTYKAFTGMAGLEYGFADKEKKWNCTGSWDGFNSNDWQNCWNLDGHGELDLRGGIVNSCDVVFYEIAKEFFYAGKTQGGTISDTAMQDVIKMYGFGRKTGIDLFSEAAGRVPAAEWKNEYFKDMPEEASWRGGDMTNMVIGQGYVLITPLQLAMAYGGIATGKLMKPHVLKEVRNSLGETIFTYEPEVIDTPKVKAENLAYIRDALHGVATENYKLVDLFGELGIDAACKTGTAEVAGKNDYAWFACYGPYENPRYVATCVVEEGGGGSDTASPIGARALAAAIECDTNYTYMGVGKVASSTGKFQAPEVVDNQRTD